jgi:Peptidase family M1 domain
MHQMHALYLNSEVGLPHHFTFSEPNFMRVQIALLLAVFYVNLAAQNTDLFLPRNFEAAYNKGIRSKDGKPGPNYWQNRSEYTIDVTLDPKAKTVKGSQTSRYFNNSPDSLKTIRLKLQHDLYKKGGQRMDDMDPKDVTDGVVVSKLEIDGVAVPESKQNRHDCYLDIRLAKPLAPGKSLQIGTAWKFKMPENEAAPRECVCTPGTFFIPYFYPEVAVYDDLHGWADAPYNGLQEFYHDFSDYDVHITVPKGYGAWATGEWQNAEAMLQPEVYGRWQQAHRSNEVIQVFSEAELTSGKAFKKSGKNVFHFIAKEVPDFTFAVSNHYNWDATSVVVDQKTGRRTFVSAVYDTKSKDFKKVARIAADGIELMSNYLPGYPFPYPCHTVFNGDDGMEYPMMVNDASVSEDGVMGLTLHETAHMYFPFMMGINEQYYAWMDEGWANFFEHFTTDSLSHTSSQIWGGGFGADWDVPPMVPSRHTTGNTYWFEAYTRPQLAYTQLLDLLGYEKFHLCMTAYIDRWKGKHPGPYEFFNTFNDVSGQNLNWFWKPWFFEFGYPDLAIASVAFMDDQPGQTVIPKEIIIQNKGNVPVPLHLTLVYTDGSKEVKHEKASVWMNNPKKQVSFVTAPGKTLKSATLGGKTIPDSKNKDNTWQEK